MSCYVSFHDTGVSVTPEGVAVSESQDPLVFSPNTVVLLGVCGFVWLLTRVLRINTQILVLA